MKKSNKSQIKTELSQFTGTEGYHSYMGNLLLTDGAKYFATACEAFWLLDVIFSIQTNSEIKKEELQICSLNMTGETSARVEITDGDKRVLHTQEIPFTDFPLDEITIWAILQGQHRVILLPSEY